MIVMEAISREFRVALPWELLYADDLLVIAETEEDLIKRLNEWKNNVENRGDILCPAFSASRVQHISDLNSHKGHAMCGSMADIQSPTTEIKPGKKEERKRRNTAKI